MSEIVIPNDVKKDFPLLKKLSGLTTDELEVIWNKCKKEIVTKAPDLTADDLVEMVKRKFHRETREIAGSTRSPALPREGFFCGDTGAMDWIAIRKRVAKALFDNPDTKQRAIMQGYTDNEGIPLDGRKFINFKRNPNFQTKPYPDGANSWYREYCGIVDMDGEKQFFRMQIRDENVKSGEKPDSVSFVVPMYKSGKFRANVANRQPENGDYLRLNFSKTATKWKDGKDQLSDEEMYDWIKRSNSMTHIKNLMKWYKEHADEKGKCYEIVVTEADVRRLSPSASEKTGNRMMVLDDFDLGYTKEPITCWIPSHIEANIEKDDRVIVFAKAQIVTQERGGEKFRDIQLNIIGIFKIPKKYQLGKNKEEESEEDYEDLDYSNIIGDDY